MSNDNKTLAEVQPGGMVRLGDQAERVRFEAWGRTEGLPLARAKLGGYAFEVTAKAWRAWQYLSAQPSPGATALGLQIVVDPTVPPDTFEVRRPSPGGQGVVDDYESITAVTERLGSHAYVAEQSGERRVRKDIRALLADHSRLQALAARQPVGHEPEDAIERIARLLYLRSCNRHVDGSPYTEWEPMDDRIKDYYRKDAQNYEALRNCALWPAGRENYTAPPAQAVDLGQFRDLAEFALRNAKLHNFWEKREALARELLAQIDIQAVGNG